MKLSEIAAKPKLIEVEINDEETVKQFGEGLTFYTYDRQPMDVFVKLANLTDKNTGDLIEVVKTLILDENGKQVLTEKNMLPINILMKAIAKVTEQLGK